MASAEREQVIARLAAAGCVAPAGEADALLGAGPDAPTLEAWLGRREHGEPLAWIVGTTPFGGTTVRVAPGVYVPRPQSEELARRAAAALPAGGRLLDLCTGSGAVAAAVAVAAPTARVVGLDLSPRSARCAAANGVATVVADVRGAPIRPASIDVVVAVAPYVPGDALRLLPPDVLRHEPRLALDGGRDGLEVVRAVIGTAAVVLRPRGWLALELGGEQPAALARDLQRHGFADTETWADEHGDVRGLITRRR